ncbi:aspartate/glutamate racemase family protein [Mesorhizobium sp. B2-6-1]|uniref:aspartate/glutamate racemase family protein n=1 Tax=Mesorhizobium sp. B2-6-1 TaxID=2589916 RepID=UPI001125D809|nr:aspartate/glutamate racemase family protein [Mesorhizobium sp. B2-6-1]TPJ57656.1 Asp/Glu racemase [Mesorhizobium sp. B2-6-1]
MRVLLINPNSNRIFTDLMDRNVEPLRAGRAYQIDCVTLEGTPPGIETQRDIDSVIEPLCRLVVAEARHTDAFVIGCFADTGLYSAREVTAKPVLGICESGLSTALNLGERFGVVSTSSESRNAELRLVRSYGLLERCVGFEPVDVPVADIPTSATAKARVLTAATRLKALGADVLVLGCAGMAPYKSLLRETFKIPVVDPSVSAVAMAIGIVSLATG